MLIKDHEVEDMPQRVTETFQPLEAVTKPLLTTTEFCHYTNLAKQTAWLWSCKDSGKVKPVRIGGKLGWPTKDVKALCGVQ
jgi:predicted DNA-binding transcriptional regulator AlpA